MSSTRKALGAASVVAAALSISACLTAVNAGTKGGPARAWQVDFELSGGFAGAMRQITVSHSGRLVAEDLRRQVRVEKKLSVDQLQELDRLVERTEPGPGTGFPGRCADCMQYRLRVTKAEGRPTVSESGAIEQRQSGNPELLVLLTAILNEALQP
jgi:hypothetical protein